MSIAIVTDTTAYIPNNLLEKYQIYTIPLSVVFGEEAYREDKDITTEEFYEKVRTSKELPSTTQPQIGMFVELFEKLSDNYEIRKRTRLNSSHVILSYVMFVIKY